MRLRLIIASLHATGVVAMPTPGHPFQVQDRRTNDVPHVPEDDSNPSTNSSAPSALASVATARAPPVDSSTKRALAIAAGAVGSTAAILPPLKKRLLRYIQRGGLDQTRAWLRRLMGSNAFQVNAQRALAALDHEEVSNFNRWLTEHGVPRIGERSVRQNEVPQIVVTTAENFEAEPVGTGYYQDNLVNFVGAPQLPDDMSGVDEDDYEGASRLAYDMDGADQGTFTAGEATLEETDPLLVDLFAGTEESNRLLQLLGTALDEVELPLAESI